MTKYMKSSPRPLYETSAYDTQIVAIAQGFKHGKVGVQMSETKDGITIRSFRSYVRASLIENALERLRQKPPQGTVLIESINTISSEICENRGFRRDGKALYKTFGATITANNFVMFRSTLQAATETPSGIKPDETHTCKIIEVSLPASEAMRLLIAMYAAYTHNTLCRSAERERTREWQLDIVCS